MNEWINILDRSPPRYKQVLVLTRHNRYFIAHHHGEIPPEWENDNCTPIEFITHWMPLPQTPETSHD
jgi:hypothetical protein